jgi:hypothetical protein
MSHDVSGIVECHAQPDVVCSTAGIADRVDLRPCIITMWQTPASLLTAFMARLKECFSSTRDENTDPPLMFPHETVFECSDLTAGIQILLRGIVVRCGRIQDIHESLSFQPASQSYPHLYS